MLLCIVRPDSLVFPSGILPLNCSEKVLLRPRVVFRFVGLKLNINNSRNRLNGTRKVYYYRTGRNPGEYGGTKRERN